MVKFGKTEIAKENFYPANKLIRIWEVSVDNRVISNLVKTKTNSKYLIGYLDKDIRPLVLKLPKMGGYVSNKLMSFCIDDEKLLQKYKAIWTKNEDLKNIKLSTLPVYDDRYIKTKIRAYSDIAYTNFRGLNVPEDDLECESFNSHFH